MRRRRGRKNFKICLMAFVLFSLSTLFYTVRFWNLIPEKSYTAQDFGIEIVKSDTDYNKNGKDDYTDILLGARQYVQTKPKYKSEYYAGGYPPEGIGVCTDVIWKAFQAAGYSLKELVDEDISKNLASYNTIEKPDPNIDFRRVKNLKIFFERKAQPLTLDVMKVEEWQPGDVVIYHNHIAIVSDKRNENGRPYIIHNAGQPKLEEDALTRNEIKGHYRWIQ